MPTQLNSIKRAFLGAAGKLVRPFATTVGVPVGYHYGFKGLGAAESWADNRYLQDNGLAGPYVPGHAPTIPSQMSPAERGKTPMSGAARAATEGVSVAKNTLEADGNAFFMGAPRMSAGVMTPLMVGMQMHGGVPVGEALKNVGQEIAPVSAIGSVLRAAKPTWSPMGIGGNILSGAGTAAALGGAEIAHRAVGMEAPDDLISRLNEPAWKHQYRGFNNLVAGAAGGGALTKNPWGVVAGATFGAMKEPKAMLDTMTEADVVAGRQEAINKWDSDSRLADPRIPLDRIGNLNSIPVATRDKMLELRHQRAASGEWDIKVKPRSTWKHNTPGQDIPEYESLPAGQRPSEISTAAAEINHPGLKNSPGLERMKTKVNLHPHLAVGGGVLAAGLGLYGLRKLFGKKEDEDKSNSAGYASPQIITPDRWVTAT